MLSNFGTVQFWRAASSATWGWQNSQSGATIPKSFGFEAATPYETANNVTQNLTYLNHAQTIFLWFKCKTVGEFRDHLAWI